MRCPAAVAGQAGVAADPDAGTARRDRAGIADAAAESRDRDRRGVRRRRRLTAGIGIAAEPDAGAAGRDRTGIADAAGEGRDRDRCGASTNCGCRCWRCRRPRCRCPCPPTIAPELLMPPAKVEIVTDPRCCPGWRQSIALPPARMPLPPAEIVPELLMPPAKVEIVTVAVFLLVRAGTLACRRPRCRCRPPRSCRNC